jgi:hypothetical protein
MSYDYDILQANFEAKIKEINKLKQDLVEREDEALFWYRQYEDAKEEQSKGSAKTKFRHYDLERGKGT